jgi:glucokinase
MSRQAVVLGIDIGGTRTKIGFVTKEGKVVSSASFDTEAKKPYSNFEDKLENEVQKMQDEAYTYAEVIAIGIGAPNANFHSGNMEYPPNFNWGKTVPIVASVKAIFGLPVTIANDANAAALGELEFGVGKQMKNFVLLTLGTGLGSGIIVNGKPLVGEHGMAGEIGHVNVNPQGRMCNCGLQGCLETYVSVTGIRRTVFKLISKMRKDSILRSISFDEMSGEMIAEAALKGDPIALKAFDYTGEILGSKMADTVAHLDPEAIILGGGLTKAGEILLKPTRISMEKNLFSAYKGKIKLMLSEISGSDAICGAAALAWNSVAKL